MKYLQFSALAIMLLAGYAACTNYKQDQLYPYVACAADTASAVSFTKDIQPIFNSSCVTGCHTGGSPQGHLSLDPAVAYTQLWHPGGGYVDTLNPAASVLYSSMVSVSSPMPPSGALDACKLKLVLKWIEQKGRNN
jgi:hypothetical protein